MAARDEIRKTAYGFGWKARDTGEEHSIDYVRPKVTIHVEYTPMGRVRMARLMADSGSAIEDPRRTIQGHYAVKKTETVIGWMEECGRPTDATRREAASNVASNVDKLQRCLVATKVDRALRDWVEAGNDSFIWDAVAILAGVLPGSVDMPGDVAQRYALTGNQVRVLLALSRLELMTMAEIIDVSRLRESSARGTVTAMISRGLIAEADPDTRGPKGGAMFAITAAGLTNLARACRERP